MGGNTPATGTPFDFKCPPGAYITRFSGYVGAGEKNWIKGLGPVECSDGSKTTDLWGTREEADPFIQPGAGAFASGCPGFDVTSGTISINKLSFTACGAGGGVVGGFTRDTSTSTSLRCPDGMKVVGVFGSYSASTVAGLLQIGLYCV